MTLLVVLIFEFPVGGDRIDMSSAVPRLNGTIGVNSNARSGCCPMDLALKVASSFGLLNMLFAPE